MKLVKTSKLLLENLSRRGVLEMKFEDLQPELKARRQE